MTMMMMTAGWPWCRTVVQITLQLQPLQLLPQLRKATAAQALAVAAPAVVGAASAHHARPSRRGVGMHLLPPLLQTLQLPALRQCLTNYQEQAPLQPPRRLLRLARAGAA